MIIIKWFAPIVIAVWLIYSIIWLIFDIKDSITVAKALDVSVWTLLDMRTKVVIVMLFLTLFIASILAWV